MRIGPTGSMAVPGTGILNKSGKKLKSVEAKMPAVRQKGWCHKIAAGNC
jgi:protein involved in polysaccharide export with SLBB domain